jgi:hypothetical protein
MQNIRTHIGKSMGALALTVFCTLLSAQSEPDPHLWLEDLKNPAATQWVDEQSQKSLNAIRKMPGFDERYKANLRFPAQ